MQTLPEPGEQEPKAGEPAAGAPEPDETGAPASTPSGTAPAGTAAAAARSATARQAAVRAAAERAAAARAEALARQAERQAARRAERQAAQEAARQAALNERAALVAAPPAPLPTTEPEPPEHSGTHVAPDPREAMRKLRRRRQRILALRLAVFIGLPTASAGYYYGAVASNQYESTTLFTVYAAEYRPPGGLEVLMGVPTATPALLDALTLRDYVLSRDVLSRLDKEHGFLTHYRSQEVDWLSRLPAGDSFEDAHAYYQGKVKIEFDNVSGLLTLHVRAFSPEKAEQYAKAIVAYSEELVNQLAEKSRVDKTNYAEKHVKLAEERYQKARAELTKIQQEKKVLDPVQEAAATIQLRTGLEAELAKARAELQTAESYMRPDAPQVIALRQKVASMGAQVGGQSARMVAPKSEKGLDTSLAKFETAFLEKEFAQKAYESSLTYLETARIEASRQSRYLATVTKPFAPDETTHPKRLLSVFTVFIASFLLMGIAWLFGSAVKEHARL